MKNKKISIILADDHPIVQKGITNVLQKNENFNLLGVASNGEEALAMVKKNNPDVLLTDISMPELSGIDLTKEILSTNNLKTRVIILSMHENQKYIQSSFDAGAKGYVLKDAEEKEIVEAIQQVVAGKIYCSKSVSQILFNELLSKNKEEKNIKNIADIELSKRETEVLELIYEGFSNKQIASKIFLSTRTVDAHRYNIMQKLEVKNTAELIKKALALKLINP